MLTRQKKRKPSHQKKKKNTNDERKRQKTRIKGKLQKRIWNCVGVHVEHAKMQCSSGALVSFSLYLSFSNEKELKFFKIQSLMDLIFEKVYRFAWHASGYFKHWNRVRNRIKFFIRAHTLTAHWKSVHLMFFCNILTNRKFVAQLPFGRNSKRKHLNFWTTAT